MTIASPAASVYERVLGGRLEGIDPALRVYFGAPPTGMLGEGGGRFTTAGSRLRALRPLFAWMARRQILFPERDTDVPFTVVNTPAADGSLHAVRTFHFSGRVRTLSDAMSVVDGRLVDRIGVGGLVEVVLDVTVAGGGIHLQSTSLALHVGGRRIPIPPVVRVTVDERFARGRQHVDVRLRSPLIGEVFGYAGSFTYTHVPIERLRR